ncbi:DoxX family protein [Nocardiopsis changdeensis]|uniref:DoxX family protein n=1 Tax=Nocardiopsis changdeensis TaxID=2831969 RepID=A0ABX8BKB6_9ACTN|nr:MULTISPECIES: DoxX family protein [Nocardiopsis]QUX22541.1 DoxX family protein [Nocardiopsis changdeensis]QYX38482.1 DoxX family protein [Nocardiopsis sp. MT53]
MIRAPHRRSILPPAVGDVAALIARVAVGVVFVAHGLPKAADLEGTAQGFASLGIPFPAFSALLGAAIEVGGGLALIVGLALPLAGLALAFMMANAYYFAHLGDPLVGGYEFLLVLGATSLALGFAGGRYSLDSLLPWGRRGRSRAAEAVTA